ncbi:MAG: DUF1583 domain-containing protein, partial [Planctomycetaceae bacterium]|nr:DUF1583 domain-containing protein [Planctomycetaceae bacterium]
PARVIATRNASGDFSQLVAQSDYLVYQACLQSPEFAHLYADRLTWYRTQLQDFPLHLLLQDVNRDWSARNGTEPVEFGSRFLHWAAVHGSEASGAGRPWWSAFEGQIVQVDGSDRSCLYFRYPLIGDFTIDVDCYEDGWNECDLGFSGVAVLSQHWSDQTPIESVSGHDEITRPGGIQRPRPAWNRVTVEVREGQMRFFLNTSLVYEEPVSPGSPWLYLRTEGSRISAYRNLQIQGDLVIPDQVELIVGDRLDGWNCSMFGESQPRRRLMAETPTSENDMISYLQRNEPASFDWSAENGVLQARRIDHATSRQQSWIYYQRPLMDRESFEYEFFYQPGRSVAHPTIGRLALMLDSDAVRTHWIASVTEEHVDRIEPDNALTESDIQRHPGKLPLRPNDWNHVSLQLNGQTASVTLNGVVVCERAIEPHLSHRFGLFRHRGQSVQVRNAVLKGNWAETQPKFSGSELLELAAPDSRDSVFAVDAVLADRTAAMIAGEVVLASRQLPPTEAIALLAEWVLPSQTHAGIRLYSAQVPHDKAPEAFGGLLCPATELVRLSIQHNRTTLLTDFINRYVPTDDVSRRNRNAFQALLALELNDEDAIRTALKDVWLVVEQPYPVSTIEEERQAEFIVAWRAAQHPRFWAVGEDICRKLRDYQRNGQLRPRNDLFGRRIHTLAGDLQKLVRAKHSADITSGTAANSSSHRQQMQWQSVPYLKLEDTSSGAEPSTWGVVKGVATHHPGDTWSQLFFQSPLTGQFEIRARCSTYGYREMVLAWGMHAAQPRYDLRARQVTRVMHGMRDIEQN